MYFVFYFHTNSCTDRNRILNNTVTKSVSYQFYEDLPIFVISISFTMTYSKKKHTVFANSLFVVNSVRNSFFIIFVNIDLLRFESIRYRSIRQAR